LISKVKEQIQFQLPETGSCLNIFTISKVLWILNILRQEPVRQAPLSQVTI